MATSHGPDLSAARRASERLMDDRCQIWRYPESSEEDVLDPETGQLIARPPVMIYPTQAMIDDPDDDSITDGPCQFRTVGEGFTSTQTKAQGGDPQTYRMYNTKLPIDKAPVDIKEGDWVVCTSSRRDPALPGREFVVREPMVGSFSVTRKLLVEGQPPRRVR